MRILLSLLFLIIISVIGNTQNTCTHDFDDPYQSLWKYWNTRNVFNEHFIKSSLDENGELLNDGIGEWLPNKLRYEYGGYNLPASHLYMTTNPSYIYDCYHGDTNPNVYNVLKWGDSPIKLGRYIATICTEYKLLELNGQYELRDQKIKELFLALQAYRRLDMTANRLWEEYLKFFDCTYHEGDISAGITEPWTGHNPDLSGYSGWFLREDVPSDFYNVIGEDDYPEEWQVGSIDSDYACEMYDEHFKHFNKNVLSIDQVIGMLFGLAFVKKYIPSTARVNINGQQYRPLQMARNIATGMVNRIHGTSNKNIEYPRAFEPEFHDLPVLTCPNGSPVFGNVPRGYDATFVIYGMCEVANYILDGYAHINTVRKGHWDIARAGIFNDLSSNPDNHRMYLELMTAGSVNYNYNAEDFAHHNNNYLMQHFTYKALHGNNISSEDMNDMKDILCDFDCPGACLKTPTWVSYNQ